jgi:hypothetical protein
LARINHGSSEPVQGAGDAVLQGEILVENADEHRHKAAEKHGGDRRLRHAQCLAGQTALESFASFIQSHQAIDAPYPFMIPEHSLAARAIKQLAETPCAGHQNERGAVRRYDAAPRMEAMVVADQKIQNSNLTCNEPVTPSLLPV